MRRGILTFKPRMQKERPSSSLATFLHPELPARLVSVFKVPKAELDHAVQMLVNHCSRQGYCREVNPVLLAKDGMRASLRFLLIEVGPAQDIDPEGIRTNLGAVLALRGALSEAKSAL